MSFSKISAKLMESLKNKPGTIVYVVPVYVLSILEVDGSAICDVDAPAYDGSALPLF